MELTEEQKINKQIQDAKGGENKLSPFNTNLISDGYHTFGELYDHRITLFIALCRTEHFNKDSINKLLPQAGMTQLVSPSKVWRSRKHSDGELAFGGSWFVLGIGKENGKQITYHLPLENWGDCEFAETLDKAPEFDGHTSADVLERLKQL